MEYFIFGQIKKLLFSPHYYYLRRIYRYIQRHGNSHNHETGSVFICSLQWKKPEQRSWERTVCDNVRPIKLEQISQESAVAIRRLLSIPPPLQTLLLSSEEVWLRGSLVFWLNRNRHAHTNKQRYTHIHTQSMHAFPISNVRWSNHITQQDVCAFQCDAAQTYRLCEPCGSAWT